MSGTDGSATGEQGGTPYKQFASRRQYCCIHADYTALLQAPRVFQYINSVGMQLLRSISSGVDEISNNLWLSMPLMQITPWKLCFTGQSTNYNLVHVNMDVIVYESRIQDSSTEGTWTSQIKHDLS